ncbi:MAG: hypothetical protein S4CHLAM123_09540 [Chlamydiales bacterium]|nr:hypothetical protein [Chlamydiales bacterium]
MNQAHAIGVQKKQSAISLTAIQVTGATSLPVLGSSIGLYHEYGGLHALIILVCANFLIWLVAVAIISMTAGTTKNTLDNARDYLGKTGAFVAALILIVSTIAWFVIQTNYATQIILHILPSENAYHINTFLQVGVGLGVFSTLVSMEGINGLKWLALIAFPILVVAFVSNLFLIPDTLSPIFDSVSASIGSLAIAIGTSLSVAVDYPTFFQHSQSKKHSFIAVSAIQLITLFIGVGGLFLGRYISNSLEGWDVILQGSSMAALVLFFVLAVLSCLCVNSVNIYSASIAWELVAPVLAGRKEYTILGLALTSIFVLTTNLVPMRTLLVVTDVFLSGLCLVLVLGYLGKLWLKQPLEKLDRWICLIGLLVGTTIALIGGLQKEVVLSLLISGFLVSILVVAITVLGRKLVITRQ